MLNILQRNWFNTVHRDDNKGLLDARTVYCGTDGEMSVLLKVTMDKLEITNATWEKYSQTQVSIDIDELIGVTAYLGSGNSLKQALKKLDAFPRSLFAETVRGIIQAETFLWSERGFPSTKEYSAHWEKVYLNSCCYYSNLDKVQQSWDDYAYSNRSTTLFNRFKSQMVYLCPDGNYQVHGLLSDSFHEVNINLTFNQNLKITEVRGSLLRVPDQVCRQATNFLPRLLGQKADQLNKKQVASWLGKGDGCVHLIDTAYDGIETMQLAKAREGNQT